MSPVTVYEHPANTLGARQKQLGEIIAGIFDVLESFDRVYYQLRSHHSPSDRKRFAAQMRKAESWLMRPVKAAATELVKVNQCIEDNDGRKDLIWRNDQ